MQETKELLSPLLKMLHSIAPMSRELEEDLIANFHPKKIEKGFALLHENEVCRNLCFLANGILRAYHTIAGKEITSRIMLTNHIVISPGSFFKQTPSTEALDAIKDSTLVVLKYADLQGIYSRHPEFNFHTRLVTEDYFAKIEIRQYMLRQHDPMDRYNYFLENYSVFLRYIPQKFIASFLNITPETLSRIRKRVSVK